MQRYHSIFIEGSIAKAPLKFLMDSQIKTWKTVLKTRPRLREQVNHLLLYFDQKAITIGISRIVRLSFSLS